MTNRAIDIEGYSFSNPFRETSRLENRSGVYVIISNEDGKYIPIDVGESSHIRDRIESHDRKQCWKKKSSGTLLVTVLYTSNKKKRGRKKIEQLIRNKYEIVCGNR